MSGVKEEMLRIQIKCIGSTENQIQL